METDDGHILRDENAPFAALLHRAERHVVVNAEDGFRHAALLDAFTQEIGAELDRAHAHNLGDGDFVLESGLRHRLAIADRRAGPEDDQGDDQDGNKGLYHLNAVDEVTQWEIVAATPQISEFWLLPVLEAILLQFPFVIRGFHSDNGSEFINYTVARLLEKLLIEQTRSRPHRSGDNGLVESKNGAIIRKHIGYGYIAAQHAEAMDRFHREYLNPYLNFHRPCAVPTILTQANGKRRRIYRRWATPLELFRELPGCERFLRPGVTLAELESFAQLQSDTEAALAMQRAKRKLLGSVKRTQTA